MIVYLPFLAERAVLVHVGQLRVPARKLPRIHQDPLHDTQRVLEVQVNRDTINCKNGEKIFLNLLYSLPNEEFKF